MRCEPTTTLLCFLLLPLVAVSLPVRKSSRQYLPPIPGYIPVYIQDGDVPPDVESIVKEYKGQETASDPVQNDAVQMPDDTLKESGDEIVQQLTQGPVARLFFKMHTQANKF